MAERLPRELGPVFAIDAVEKHDVKSDGCAEKPSTSRLPDTDPDDGTKTSINLYAPCTAGTAVVFYAIEGGGHAWPGGETIWTLARQRNTPRDFDAAAVIWDFFRKYTRR